MSRRRKSPTDQEVFDAIIHRIRTMTREDWIRSIEELSRAPEGVEDPWPPYDSLGSNGSEQPDAEAMAPNTAPPDAPIVKPQTLADLFAGRTGTIRSGGAERLSEECGAKFADHLEAKRKAGHL